MSASGPVGAMELVGVSVRDLDAAVDRFSRVLGLEFEIFTPGSDYAVSDAAADGVDAAPALAPGARIAMDATGCFELVELPDEPEGTRNIHFRVDDLPAAVQRATDQGLRVVRDIIAGDVREVVFDRDDLHGIRLCLLAYDGASLADALRASPRPAG